MHRYRSWGRYPPAVPRGVLAPFWRSEVPPLAELPGPVLPFGRGRSYGDSCLNDGGFLLDTAGLDRFIGFDPETGLLRCEAGVTLGEVLATVAPRGWFPPVVPGTKWVSVGGAIANDIHGKNHHVAGTFGCHVTRFELLRSTGERVVCSAAERPELFRATIGGLGLTGLILWAEFRLKRVPGPWIRVERIRVSGLDQFFDLSEADREFEYTVAWIDTLARGRRLGRGVYLRGNHVPGGDGMPVRADSRFRVPCDAPGWLLNPLTVGAFNALYYRRQLRRAAVRVESPDAFLFPLDAVADWNRLYGRRGFLQYQCVIPGEGRAAVREILERVARSREGSFLSVLKRFGSVASPGVLSFPRPGVTLALDFPYRGERTLALLRELDRVVCEASGRVYPAKDARMDPETFRRSFPDWPLLAAQVDPKFSSSFWRRVAGPGTGASDAAGAARACGS